MTGGSKEHARWSETKALIGEECITLGPYFTYHVKHTPRHILHSMSYHKFAAKMIGKGKRVLEVGCSEGFQTVLLAEFAQYCCGVDVDEAAIASANKTFARENLEFRVSDIMECSVGEFDAATSFDVIEHIYPANEDRFVGAVANHLTEHGMAIIGTPNITADQFASPITRSGHVNLYSMERLEATLLRHFHHALMFAANDEVVHTGFAQMAHYLIGIGIAPRRDAT